MQSLHFFGVGSGFSNSHNNCMYIDDDKMVFIDMSMLNVDEAVKSVDWYLGDSDKKREVFVLITHMHPDHVSGLAMFILRLFYEKGLTITLGMPNSMRHAVLTFLSMQSVLRKTQQDREMYKVVDIDIPGVCLKSNSWHNLGIEAIPTPHAPELSWNYGYFLKINNNTCVVYTGDTNTLEPFYKYIDACPKKYNLDVYTDMSFVYGADKEPKDRVHILFNDSKDAISKVLNNEQVKRLYFMHVDNMQEAFYQEMNYGLEGEPRVKVAMAIH